MNINSYERTKDLSPAYWISEFGVLKEANWDENNPPAGHRPLYWKRERLPTERIREMYEESGGKPLVFARLIEQEHGIK